METTVLSWDQAQSHPCVQAAELVRVAREAGLSTRAIPLIAFERRASLNSFSCVLLATETTTNPVATETTTNPPLMVVQADETAHHVFPGLDQQMLLDSGLDVLKAFIDPVRIDAFVEYCVNFRNNTADGLPKELWSSEPGAHVLDVHITVCERVSFENSKGDLACVFVCELVDVTTATQAARASMAALRVEQEVEQSLLEHRLANMIHAATLLVGEGKPEQAVTQLNQLRTLMDVCRNNIQALSREPVSVNDFLRDLFPRGVVCEQGAQSVQFKVGSQLVAPDLIKYRVLTDIASNCFKHGTAAPPQIQVQRSS